MSNEMQEMQAVLENMIESNKRLKTVNKKSVAKILLDNFQHVDGMLRGVESWDKNLTDKSVKALKKALKPENLSDDTFQDIIIAIEREFK